MTIQRSYINDPRPTVSADHIWQEDDFIGEAGKGILQTPRLGTDDAMSSYLTLWQLMLVGETVHEPSLMISPNFVLAALDLQESGWPVELKSGPLRVVWKKEVSEKVRAAWRRNYGNRGRTEIRKFLVPITMYRRVEEKPKFAF